MSIPGIYGPKDDAGGVFDGDEEYSFTCTEWLDDGTRCDFDGEVDATRRGDWLYFECPNCGTPRDVYDDGFRD